MVAGQVGICFQGEAPVILGLDPGRDKTGWALVRSTGDLVFSGIFPTPETSVFLKIAGMPPQLWEEKFSVWLCERRASITGKDTIECIAVGNGTGSGEIVRKANESGLKTFLVDETGTTLKARELYWRLHRPAWWQRCLPRSLRVPPRVLDDLAAWAIALRCPEGLECGE